MKWFFLALLGSVEDGCPHTRVGVSAEVRRVPDPGQRSTGRFTTGVVATG